MASEDAVGRSRLSFLPALIARPRLVARAFARALTGDAARPRGDTTCVQYEPWSPVLRASVSAASGGVGARGVGTFVGVGDLAGVALGVGAFTGVGARGVGAFTGVGARGVGTFAGVGARGVGTLAGVSALAGVGARGV